MLGLLVLLLLFTLAVWFFFIRRVDKRRFPFPTFSGLPFLGLVPRTGLNDALLAAHKSLGRPAVFETRVMGKKMIIVDEPLYGVLSDDQHFDFWEVQRRAIPRMVPFSSMAWEKHTDELVAPIRGMLRGVECDGFFERAKELAVSFFADFQANGPVDILNVIQRLSFASTLGSLFGDELVKRYPKLMDDVTGFDRGVPLSMAGVPWLFLPGVRKHVWSIANALFSCKDDAPSAVIRERWEILGRHNVVEPGLHQTTLAWASVTNTVPTTTWMLLHLANDAELQREVRAELHAVGVNHPSDLRRPLMDSCKLLHNVLYEVLRVYMENLGARICTNDIELEANGKKFSFVAGDEVFVATQLYHKNENVFANPTKFDAHRELPISKMRVWGGGSHQCSGRIFVTSQIKMIIASFVLQFDMELKDKIPTPEPRNGFGTMWPGDKPVMVQLTPRG